MRLKKDDTDCADCLCRVCANSMDNDSRNEHGGVIKTCRPCESCVCGESYCIEVDTDCMNYLPDEGD